MKIHKEMQGNTPWKGANRLSNGKLYILSYIIPATLRTETKEVSAMYQVKYVFGHYNVYAPSGRFLFSADTESEAWDELEQMES